MPPGPCTAASGLPRVGRSRARWLERPLRGRVDPDVVPSAFLPAVGRPQQQGLAACATVGGRVAAVDWGRHGVLLFTCREPGERGESTPRAGGARLRARAGAERPELGSQAALGTLGPGCRGRAERRPTGHSELSLSRHIPLAVTAQSTEKALWTFAVSAERS